MTATVRPAISPQIRRGNAAQSLIRRLSRHGEIIAAWLPFGRGIWTPSGSESLLTTRASKSSGILDGRVIPVDNADELTVDHAVYAAYTQNVRYASDFSNAVWTKTDGTWSADAVESPDGTQSADKSVKAAGDVDISATQTFPAALAAPVCFSVYVRAVSGHDWVSLALYDTGYSTWRTAYFDLQNAAWGTVDGIQHYRNETLGNGWIRLWIVADNGSNFDAVRVRVAGGDGVDSVAGIADGNGAAWWGAQCNQGRSPKPVIPYTTGSAYAVDDQLAQFTFPEAQSGAAWMLGVMRHHHHPSMREATEAICSVSPVGDEKAIEWAGWPVPHNLRFVTYKAGTNDVVSITDEGLKSRRQSQPIAYFLSFGPSGRRGYAMAADGYGVSFSDAVDHTPDAANPQTVLYFGSRAYSSQANGEFLVGAYGKAVDVLSDSACRAILRDALGFAAAVDYRGGYDG